MLQCINLYLFRVSVHLRVPAPCFSVEPCWVCFSLNHLSLTSRLLRDVCGSLLNSRGLVLLLWRRLQHDGGVTWRPVAQVTTRSASRLTSATRTETRNQQPDKFTADKSVLTFML